MQKLNKKKVVSPAEWLVFGCVIIGALVNFYALRALALESRLLRVYFLDVGQGDAIFIQAPNGNQVLIDGGPGSQVIQELSRGMPFQDHSIDLVVLTHPHADHVDGLIEALKRYDVGQILENYYQYDSADYAEWNKLKSEAQVTQARAGQVIDLGMDVKILILYPDEQSANQNIKNPNNASVVIKLIYGNESLLLTGDIEAPVEQKLLDQQANLDSDFLKVGHHGSKTSTTDAFLRAVTPIIAFIEVGAENRYGHPHPTILQRLENFGIKYYRTDVDGTKELILDGQNYFVK